MNIVIVVFIDFKSQRETGKTNLQIWCGKSNDQNKKAEESENSSYFIQIENNCSYKQTA